MNTCQNTKDISQMSESEKIAIDWLKKSGGSILITSIPEFNKRDIFGDLIPGLKVFKKLEKKGLVIFTDPVIADDGFCFTPSVDLL